MAGYWLSLNYESPTDSDTFQGSACVIRMMRVIYWTYLFLPFLFVAGQQYYISDGSATEQNASQLCNLATPPTTFSRTGQRVQLLVPQIDQPLWVGYAETYTAFSYKRCFYVIPGKNYTSTNTRRDPGHCFSFCKTRYIGLSSEKATCNCIEYSDDLLFPYPVVCRGTCEFPNDILCSDYSNRMAIYEHVPYTDLAFSKDENTSHAYCLAYDPTGRRSPYAWHSCRKTFNAVCQEGVGNSTKYRRMSKSRADYGPWSDSVMMCAGVYMLPVDNVASDLKNNRADLYAPFWTGIVRSFSILETEDHMLPVHNGASDLKNNRLDIYAPFWTGIVRSFSILDIEDLPRTGGHRQGYLLKDGNGSYNLSFNHKGKSLHALCNGPRPTLDPSTTHRSSASSTVSTEMATLQLQSSNNQEGAVNKGLVAVYVVVPVVLILSVVVAGLIFWRWRKRSTGPAFNQPVYVNTATDEVPNTMSANTTTEALPNTIYANTTTEAVANTDEDNDTVPGHYETNLANAGEETDTVPGHYETNLQVDSSEHPYSELENLQENDDTEYEMVDNPYHN